MDAVTKWQLDAVRRILLRLHLLVCGVLLVVGSLVPFQVGVLMAVGALVPTLVAGLSSRSTENTAAGPGMACYYAGTVLFLMLMYSEELDALRHD